MRVLGATVAAALLSLSSCSGPALAQGQTSSPGPQSIVVSGQRDLSSWLRAESPHFIVYSNTQGADAARLLDQLERLDTLLRLYTAPMLAAGRDPGRQPNKLTLYYLDGTGGFARFAPDAPQDAIGMVKSCAAGVLGVGVQLHPIAQLSDAQLAREPLDEGQSYLFEAYARHFLFRYTDVRAPTALIEGMAQYFSTVRFSNSQMAVGRTPTALGRYLGFLDEGAMRQLDYDDVFARTYAFRPHPGDVRARASQLEFEARAWTLVHYMLSSADNRRRMGVFLDAVHNGQPAGQAFARSYDVAPGQVSTVLWRYRQPGMKVLRVQLPPASKAPVAIRPLSHAAGEFVLLDAMRAGCPGSGAGKDLLSTVRELAAAMPNSEAARASLSRARVEWGDAGEVRAALPYLEQAAARDGDDAEAAYWLGRANLRLAPGDPTRLPPAREQLARASALRPGAPEIALARLQAALEGAPQPDRPALDAVIQAWRDGRDANPLAREAALAMAFTGDADGVLHVLRVLANDSRDPDSQAWAATWRSRLEHGVPPSDLFAEMRRVAADSSAGGALKEWTIDQTSVAEDVERRAGMEAARKMLDLQPAVMGQTPQPNPIQPNPMLR